MVNSRASAVGGTTVRGWTLLRPLGARAVTTLAAKATLPTGGSEVIVVQTWPTESDRSGEPLRDVRALVNLRHPNVAKIKEVIDGPPEVSVLTTFVEGETLAALRRTAKDKGTRIPIGVELRILVDVLAGVAAIHAAKDSKLKPLGIIHGEMAPANVVVGLDGVPRIIQLCGVHAMPSAQGADSVAYLAPEVLLADDAFDQRVDVYGAGVMLWEALAGEPLFTETTAGAIVTRHLSGRIRKPSVPGDSAWAEPLVEVAMKAIATDPGARWATANDLATEIKRIAKTNLATAARAAALVKELGGDAIAKRTAELSGKPVAAPTPAPPAVGPKATAFAIKVPEAPKAPEARAAAKPAEPAKPEARSFSKPPGLPGRPSIPARAPIAQPAETTIDEIEFDLAPLADDAKPAKGGDSDPLVHDRITSPGIDPALVEAAKAPLEVKPAAPAAPKWEPKKPFVTKGFEVQPGETKAAEASAAPKRTEMKLGAARPWEKAAEPTESAPPAVPGDEPKTFDTKHERRPSAATIPFGGLPTGTPTAPAAKAAPPAAKAADSTPPPSQDFPPDALLRDDSDPPPPPAPMFGSLPAEAAPAPMFGSLPAEPAPAPMFGDAAPAESPLAVPINAPRVSADAPANAGRIDATPLPPPPADEKKKKRAIILFAVGGVLLILLVAFARMATRDPTPDGTAATKPTQTATASATTAAPTVTAEPTATEAPAIAATPPPVATTAAPPEPTTTAPAEPTTTASTPPVATAQPSKTASPPSGGDKKPGKPAKPKPTYDPLGI